MSHFEEIRQKRAEAARLQAEGAERHRQASLERARELFHEIQSDLQNNSPVLKCELKENVIYIGDKRGDWRSITSNDPWFKCAQSGTKLLDQQSSGIDKPHPAWDVDFVIVDWIPLHS